MIRENAISNDPIASGKDDPSDIKATEVDADGFAETLAKDVDYMKALKIQEARLTEKLRRIAEAKSKIRNRVVRRLG